MCAAQQSGAQTICWWVLVLSLCLRHLPRSLYGWAEAQQQPVCLVDEERCVQCLAQRSVTGQLD
jgi:hypothetical protein